MISDDEVLRAEGYAQAYVEVLELLDKEITKAKDRGDFQTSETIEVVRAKVNAHGMKSI